MNKECCLTEDITNGIHEILLKNYKIAKDEYELSKAIYDKSVDSKVIVWTRKEMLKNKKIANNISTFDHNLGIHLHKCHGKFFSKSIL